ncbi:TPA: hypothetical protein ACPJ10_001687 [Vibrio diabolicus]
MSKKNHAFFSRSHHQGLAPGINTWKHQHGSKLWHVKETINRALVVDWNRTGIIRKMSQVIGTNMWLTI